MVKSDQLVVYIANIVKMKQLDRQLDHREQQALETICHHLKVDNAMLEKAMVRVASGEHTLTPVGRFSDRVQNFEDMLLISLLGGEMSENDKEEMRVYSHKLGLTDDQVKMILTETKVKIDLLMTRYECRACGLTLRPDSNFCITCGTKIQA